MNKYSYDLVVCVCLRYSPSLHCVKMYVNNADIQLRCRKIAD